MKQLVMAYKSMAKTYTETIEYTATGLEAKPKEAYECRQHRYRALMQSTQTRALIKVAIGAKCGASTNEAANKHA
jgi:hypothetical protein